MLVIFIRLEQTAKMHLTRQVILLLERQSGKNIIDFREAYRVFHWEEGAHPKGRRLQHGVYR